MKTTQYFQFTRARGDRSEIKKALGWCQFSLLGRT